MGRYYNFDEEEFLGISNINPSLYGSFRDKEHSHTQRALKRTPLHEAVCVSDYDNAMELITRGDTVNAVDAHGNTPLHLAIVNQDTFPDIFKKIIKLLQQNGAKENLKNIYGQTAKDLSKFNSAKREELALLFDSPPFHNEH